MFAIANIILELKSFGLIFRSEPKAVGLTQAQVAEKAGLRREIMFTL